MDLPGVSGGPKGSEGAEPAARAIRLSKNPRKKTGQVSLEWMARELMQEGHLGSRVGWASVPSRSPGDVRRSVEDTQDLSQAS